MITLKNTVIILLIFVGLLYSQPSMGFIDPPVFIPSQIKANQPFRVQLRAGRCDFFPSAGFPIDVVQSPGNRLQLFVSGFHVVDPIECTAPIFTTAFDLPALPAGDYHFEFYVRNRRFFFMPIHNGPVAPFTVVGRPAVSAIPTLSISGMSAMMVGLLATVWFVRRTD